MRVASLLAILLLAGCSQPAPPAPQELSVRLERVVTGLEEPVYVTEIPDGSGRLAIVEQAGHIRAWDGKALSTYLDIRDRVRGGGERGLLGLAFPPDHSATKRFYVHYTDRLGDTAIARYLAPDGKGDAASERILLQVAQPYSNHNGGMIEFGPDGMLYIGLGDGGAGGDPDDRAQDTHELLGKILRIDVKGDRFSIPPDNPFASGAGGAREVWAYGLRNPWRFSFDRATGDLWIGDVGQNAWEEIDIAPAGKGGLNFGWNAFEGNHRYKDRPAPGAVPPVFEVSHSVAGTCSITGGYVYRGPEAPLRGVYFFSDYCSGQLWALTKNGTAYEGGVLMQTGLEVSSFGEDAAGNVYVVHHGGEVHRIRAAT